MSELVTASPSLSRDRHRSLNPTAVGNTPTLKAASPESAKQRYSMNVAAMNAARPPPLVSVQKRASGRSPKPPSTTTMDRSENGGSRTDSDSKLIRITSMGEAEESLPGRCLSTPTVALKRTKSADQKAVDMIAAAGVEASYRDWMSKISKDGSGKTVIGQRDATAFIEQYLLRRVVIDGMKVSPGQGEQVMLMIRNKSERVGKGNYRLLARKDDQQYLSELVQDILGFLAEQRELKKIITVQSVVRGWLVRKKFEKYNKEELIAMRKRNEVYLEIVRTERTYLAKLNLMTEHFVKPLKSILQAYESADIFCNVENVIETHRALCLILESKGDMWPFIEGIGAVFSNLGSILKALSIYVGNFKNAMNEVERQEQENPRFTALLQEPKPCEEDLPTLLALPINRISQYELLLQQYLANSMPNTTEHKECVNAFSILQESSKVVQLCLMESARAAKLYSIQRRLKSDRPVNLSIPGRRFLRESPLRKGGMAYLFSDLFIAASPPKDNMFRRPSRSVAKGVVASEVLMVKCEVELDKIDAVEVKNDNCSLDIKVLKPKDAQSPRKDSKNKKDKDKEKLYRIVCKDQQDKMTWITMIKHQKEEKKMQKVFGTPLGEIIIREERETGIPLVVEKICTFLSEEENLKKEGIFRVAGRKEEIDDLRSLFDKGNKTVQIDFSKYNIFSVCDCLKQFFRSLPVPLLGFELYKPLLEVSKNDDDKKKKTQKIKQLVLEWTPSFAVKVLKYLLKFLIKVSKYNQENKMSSENLSIIFGPTLLWSQEMTLEAAIDMPYVNSVIAVLIEEAETIFKDL